MLVKARISFAGKISMYAGEVKEVEEGPVLQDLLRAGYVEIEAQEAEIVEKPVEKSTEPKPLKKKKSKR